MSKNSGENEWQKIARQLAEERDTDSLFYVGSMNIQAARKLVDLVNGRRRRKNVLFMLGTNGGDAHAAYKIARCLQHAYDKGDFTLAVYGDCKSAGTLVAIAAKSVVMCQHGELGPLDVQLRKEDQLFAVRSGLTPKRALESLKGESLAQFEHFMLSIHARSGYQISTKLAASIAIRMVVGLLGPVYGQIDPLGIGETQRAMDIARAYGERLNIANNLKPDALSKLLEGYPSHDFAIDFDEARQLFVNLSRTDELQQRLGSELAHILLNSQATGNDDVLNLYLNSEIAEKSNNNVEINEQGQNHVESSNRGKSGKAERQPDAQAAGGPSTPTTGGDGEDRAGAAHKVAVAGRKAVVAT